MADTCPSCRRETSQGICPACGPDPGAAKAAGPPRLFLGRSAENGLVLDDPAVSRRHAVVGHDETDGWWIEDLGSTSGTYVNGRKIEGRTSFRLGDEIHLGRRQVPASSIFWAEPFRDLKAGEENAAAGRSGFWRQILGSRLTWPALLTVACVCLLFSLAGSERTEGLLYTKVLCFYLAAMAGLALIRLIKRPKPFGLGLAVATFIFLAMETPLLNLFLFIFRDILPGSPGGDGLINVFVKNFFGAGLMEELFKALPLFIGVWIYLRFKGPRNEAWGLKDSLDGVFFGLCAGLGFTLNETLFNHMNDAYFQFAIGAFLAAGASPDFFLPAGAIRDTVNMIIESGGDFSLLPEARQAALTEYLAAAGADVSRFSQFVYSSYPEFSHYRLTLAIPRVLGAVALHSAFSGCVGYFIGQAVRQRRAMALTIGKGLLLASLIHASWNTASEIFGDMRINFFIALLGLGLLLYLIVRARRQAGLPLTMARPHGRNR